jgi:hypothetical protein
VERGGLYADLVTDEHVLDVARWRECARMRLPVGRCRCGGEYQVVTTASGQAFTSSRGVRYYEAECAECGHGMVSPNGRLAPRGGRVGVIRRPDTATAGAA